MKTRTNGVVSEEASRRAWHSMCRAILEPKIKKGKAKINPETVYEIRKRLKAGERATDLARHYGISDSQVSLIKSGRAWSHVKG